MSSELIERIKTIAEDEQYKSHCINLLSIYFLNTEILLICFRNKFHWNKYIPNKIKKYEQDIRHLEVAKHIIFLREKTILNNSFVNRDVYNLLK